jgi:hypothetical protein
MSLLDYLLYHDEDNDIEPEQMTEWTPVQPSHLVALHERGLLKYREVFSHKGWHHTLREYDGEVTGTMWDGPMDAGEFKWDGGPDYDDWY